jgi:hypothetical protein
MSELTREDFDNLWQELDRDAQANEFSQGAVLDLLDAYRRFDVKDRRVVDELLASWVLGGDERRRFDALALIDEFEIRSARPAIEKRLAHLREAAGPAVQTDQAKLRRILARLR